MNFREMAPEITVAVLQAPPVKDIVAGLEPLDTSNYDPLIYRATYRLRPGQEDPFIYDVHRYWAPNRESEEEQNALES